MIPKCLVVTDVCVNGAFCSVWVPGRRPLPCRWEDSTLGSLVLFSERVSQHLLDYFSAISPFGGGGARGRGFSPFLFFTSLNSCLSETLSLAWLLWQQKLSSCPPVDWSQDFGICSQTGGKAAIQESSLILDGSPQGQSTAWVGACLDWFCCYLFLNKHPPLQ